MTDSHCHLDRCPDPALAVDPTLAALVTVGTDVARSRSALEAALLYPNVFAAVGVHPNDASQAKDDGVRAAIAELARHPLVVAIGETGFDQYWENETLTTQRAAFRWQLDLARELDKPLILHVRDKQGSEVAALAAAEALTTAGYERGVLHCFSGHERLLSVGLELGWMVSFAGNLTYRSAGNLRELARRIPLDRLLVETDSPYLAPVPHRGKTNQPAYVRHTAAVLAEAVEATPEELERLIDANAERFFRFAAARAAA